MRPDLQGGGDSRPGRAGDAVAGERSVYDILRDEAARLARSRHDVGRPAARSGAEARGYPSAGGNTAPRVVETGAGTDAAGHLRRRVLIREDGLPLPAVSLEPAAPAGAPVLLADGHGKTAAFDRARALASQGRRVLAVDVRGIGELRGHRAFYKSPHFDEADAIHAYVLGSSLVGERAEDLLVCARWWAETCGAPAVELEAVGWAVTPALHAAVAEPALFSAVRTAQRPPTWSEALAAGARHNFADVIHGVLRDYDLTDLDAAVQAQAVPSNGGDVP